MADVSIDASISTVTARGLRSLVFTTASIGYQFYVDSTGTFVYSKTIDGGVTWGAAVTIAAATTHVAFDVWFDRWTPNDLGTKIHLWYFDTTNDDVFWRSLDTASDTLGTQQIVFNGATSVAGRGTFVSGTKTTSGYLYVCYDIDAGAERGLHRSTDGGATWSANLSTTFLEATLDQCHLFPAMNTGDGNDCWALYEDISATELTLKMWDSSAAAQVESAVVVLVTPGTTDLSGQYPISASLRHSDGHLIVSVQTEHDTLTGDHRVFDITSTASFTELTALTTNIADHYNPSLFIDQRNNHIYIAYNGKRDGSEVRGTSTKVYYTKSTDGGATWSAGDTAYMEGAAAAVFQTWAPIMGPRFYVSWRVGTTLNGNAVNSLTFSAPADPHFANVVLLALNEGGADTTTSFIDQSSSAKTLTVVGNSQWSTATPPPEVTSSGLFDGVGDRITAVASADFIWTSTDPYTIDFYFRPTALGGGILSNSRRSGAATGSWYVSMEAGQFAFSASSVGGSGTTGWDIANRVAFGAAVVGNWYHIEVTFDGTNYRCFKSGVLGATIASSLGVFNPVPNGELFYIGSEIGNDGDSTGRIRSVRLTKGICRHTANFVPPLLPLPLGSSAKIIAMGQASEQDSSQAFGRTKLKSIAQSSEQDSSQIITFSSVKTIILAQSSEQDSSQAFGRTKLKPIAQSSEQDSASIIDRLGAKIIMLGLCTEHDAAFSVLWAPKVRLLERAAENNASTVLTHVKKKPISPAMEIDSASAFSKAKVKQLIQAQESDYAFAATALKRLLLSQSLELDEALNIIRFTYNVTESELRTIIVALENRILSIPLQQRSITLASENRVRDVSSETRSLTL